MSVSFDITTEFEKYMENEIKSSEQERLNNPSKEDVAEIIEFLSQNGLTEKIGDYLFYKKEKEYREFLAKKFPSYKPEEIDEIAKSIRADMEDGEDYIIEFLYENWEEIKPLIEEDYLNEICYKEMQGDSQYFYWEIFQESFLESMKEIPLILSKEYIMKLPKISFEDTEEIGVLSYISFLRRKDKKLDALLEKMEEYSSLSYITDSLSIKLRFYVDSEYYNEYLYIEATPYYNDGTPVEIENIDKIINDYIFYYEDEWESLFEEGFNKEEVESILYDLLYDIKELAYSIEEIYKDYLSEDYHKSDIYKENREFEEFIYNLNTNIPKIFSDPKYADIFYRWNKDYNDLTEFIKGDIYSNNTPPALKFNILSKYEEILPEEQRPFLKDLTETFKYNYIENGVLISFKEEIIDHKNDENPVFITDLGKTRRYYRYGVPLFLEDYKKIYKYSKKNKKYEKIYSFFKERILKNISSVDPKDIAKYLFMIKDDEKKAVRYINSRLIEDYLKGDIKADFSLKETLFTLSEELGPLFPLEFTIFLLEERDFPMYSREKAEAYLADEKIRKNIRNTLSLFYKKISSKEDIKKLIQKQMLLHNKDLKNRIDNAVKALKTEYMKPLALYKKTENILEEKAKNKVAKDFLREMTEKTILTLEHVKTESEKCCESISINHLRDD